MDFFSSVSPISINQNVVHPILEEVGIMLDIKREDQIHEYVSGNKFRKLKYNLVEAKNKGFDTVLTFGGAYSNHIAATAVAGTITGLKTIGIIRGEELANDLPRVLSENDTLRLASDHKMQLKFISRASYKEKTSLLFLEELINEFGSFYVIPEGGTNELAVKGCEEILTPNDEIYDYVCCAVGTGGTIAGIINASSNHQKVIGFPALKGDFLSDEIKKYTNKTNWHLETNYHFGGYGKINIELIEFINRFVLEQNIALDPVYTAKMIYGIFDKIKKGDFTKNTRILAIHTGGLQGVSGMNKKLSKKKFPLIRI
ncbi:1-aminocyclopropane-1-carboxylate deaminase/D-cysteine desulfhydrase [Aquimarina litoralis]|uniref:1-aminocyclopropane-1-carboxylate deaminase/D-cysteine desulfhydrase n=1 Tax=Aquimarina litoralis TaxID=584605 RepID=UPI001C5A34A9|nr:pyridoxal-phosphate dependent enzyme [Aquimarina litoralis]MBW1297887.1 pyridoxal-phosphate dependent enzyme [Aquimarina litoralis]